ncbi:MAG: hypothetical protein FH748_05645 [Balneolaceae bacterium]|nr:hypothetical protein [Balneolaceae bacterium]
MQRKIFYIIQGSLLMCVLVSYPLWFNDRAVPLASAVDVLVFKGWLHVGTLAVWGMLFLASFWKFRKPSVLITFLFVSLILALQDQLRWQPWFYQYLLMISFYVLYTAKRIRHIDFRNVIRLILIGSYVWAGIHKYNAAFIEEFIPKILQTEIVWLGYLLPVIETLLAIGLIPQRTRRISTVGLMIMHLLILIAVINGSMRFNLVLIPWNLGLMILVFILFWYQEKRAGFELDRAVLSKSIALLLTIILPSLNFVGYWDSYLSFSLYSEKTDKAYFFVSDEFKQRFSEESQQLFDMENKIYVQKLAYSELNTPMYPERRVYIEIFEKFCSEADQNFDIIIQLQTMPNPLKNEWKKETIFCEDIGYSFE